MLDKVHGQKYIWHVPTYDKAAVLNIVSSYSISPSIAQILFSRGFVTKEQIDEYLFSLYERDVAHASLLKDAQKAVDRIIKSIDTGEKILIFGDYDVDGITSSSLMMLCLLPLGAQINFFLPNRVRDGYGISSKIVKRAAANKYQLIVTVDNGITAFEAANTAKEHKIDLIITDHHREHGQLPNAYAIVNPNQEKCNYPFKGLAGVGVAFKLMSLLYECKGMTLPDKVYELLLLGTIADVVPLIGENRFWVRHGLHHVNKEGSYALTVLKQNGGVTKKSLSSTDIGFSITPQVNALGRLEDPREGVYFFLGTKQSEVKRIGDVLFELNQARKEIERGIFQQIQREIDSGAIDLEQENIILASSNTWPPGVIGLVASRLMNMYGRPALLFHVNSSGIAKGSCRSIPEFNIFDALSESSSLLTKFGGHSCAAGLSLPVKNLGKLKQNLEAAISAQLTTEDLQQKLVLDAHLQLSDLTSVFMSNMVHLEPFGHKNDQPVFYINQVIVVKKPVLLKDLHVKCAISDKGIIKQLIFFNRPELFEWFMQQEQEPFHVAVKVSENHWNGRINIELIGIDVAELP